MTFVDKFIEFSRWPTSRKVLLLMGIALPIQTLGSVGVHFGVVSTGIVDVHSLDWLMAGGVLTEVVAFVAAWLLVSAGKEGTWIAYYLIASFGSFLMLFVNAFGAWSTPLFAWPVAVLILIPLWFGERFGWFTLTLGLVLVTVSLIANLAGVVPYAPFMIMRTLDAQASAAWALSVVLPCIAFVLFSFLLIMLVLAARGLQDERLQRAQRLIRRYVPSQLADSIVKGGHSEEFRPVRTKLTVFFTDVEGFTEASDHLDPEDLAALLNEYLGEMMAIAERHGATINQIVGDGIMGFFGAPQATNDKDHALRSVRMALEMQKRMAELKDVWVQRGIQKPFRIRIGINTGHASVGDYGSPGRKLYSAIGVQTNLAARIQACCDPGKILISHSTWALVHDQIAYTDKGDLQLKGVHYAVHVYEVSEAGV